MWLISFRIRNRQTDLRQRLYDELMAVESMLANAGEVVRSAYTRKNDQEL